MVHVVHFSAEHEWAIQCLLDRFQDANLSEDPPRESNEFNVKLLNAVFVGLVTLLNLSEQLEFLEARLNQVDNFKDFRLGLVHAKAPGQNFNQVLTRLFLILSQLVLLVNDQELLLQQELLHLDLECHSSLVINLSELLILDLSGLNGAILEDGKEILAFDTGKTDGVVHHETAIQLVLHQIHVRLRELTD